MPVAGAPRTLTATTTSRARLCGVASAPQGQGESAAWTSGKTNTQPEPPGAMRGMRPELRLILPVVFVFDYGPRAPEGTSGSQFGCML